MGTYDTRGGTPRHDPSFDEDLPCAICGKDPYECECPECPVCGAAGDPKCYKEHDLQKYLTTCSKCGKPSVVGMCPYDDDVWDKETECDCCKACHQDCRDSI
jgi:hypothetical protein